MHRRMASSALAVAILGACLLFSSTTPAAADSSHANGSARRVLVVSLPHIAWHDLAGLHLPNLDALLQRAAVADMTNRTIGKRDLASAYLTIGAGTRAASTDLPVDGEGLEASEQFGTVTAA